MLGMAAGEASAVQGQLHQILVLESRPIVAADSEAAECAAFTRSLLPE